MHSDRVVFADYDSIKLDINECNKRHNSACVLMEYMCWNKQNKLHVLVPRIIVSVEMWHYYFTNQREHVFCDSLLSCLVFAMFLYSLGVLQKILVHFISCEKLLLTLVILVTRTKVVIIARYGYLGLNNGG